MKVPESINAQHRTVPIVVSGVMHVTVRKATDSFKKVYERSSSRGSCNLQKSLGKRVFLACAWIC